jgi:hypothetical protein
MEPAQRVGRGFFPLDEQSDLDRSELTPHAQESLVRLASWVPFGPAAELLEGLLGVRVSKSSARRFTLEAGEAGLQEWEEQTATLQQQVAEAPAGANQQVMSADGAMVPLVGGEWAEVKTLVMGEIKENPQGEKQVENLSYCSRLTDVAGFEQATLLEMHRRGLEHASVVAAVADGADRLQGFSEYHRADAVRILDFAHAAEYVQAIGQAVRESGHRLPAGWLECAALRRSKLLSVLPLLLLPLLPQKGGLRRSIVGGGGPFPLAERFSKLSLQKDEPHPMRALNLKGNPLYAILAAAYGVFRSATKQQPDPVSKRSGCCAALPPPS